MSKVSVDIEYIKSKLNDIGYEISDCVERENNGVNWQLKFSNSGAIVTIYDSNRTKNTVVNGKVDKDGKTDPITSTVGKVGDIYKNTITKDLFECTAVSDSTYTWTAYTRKFEYALPVVNGAEFGGDTESFDAPESDLPYVPKVSGRSSINDVTYTSKLTPARYSRWKEIVN